MINANKSSAAWSRSFEIAISQPDKTVYFANLGRYSSNQISNCFQNCVIKGGGTYTNISLQTAQLVPNQHNNMQQQGGDCSRARVFGRASSLKSN
jgi:hypothetical protein